MFATVYTISYRNKWSCNQPYSNVSLYFKSGKNKISIYGSQSLPHHWLSRCCRRVSLGTIPEIDPSSHLGRQSTVTLRLIPQDRPVGQQQPWNQSRQRNGKQPLATDVRRFRRNTPYRSCAVLNDVRVRKRYDLCVVKKIRPTRRWSVPIFDA